MKLAVVVVCCLLLAGTDGFRWNGGGSGPFVPSPHNPNPGPFSPIDPYSRREADPENTRPERAVAEQPEAADEVSGQLKRKRRGWRVRVRVSYDKKK